MQQIWRGARVFDGWCLRDGLAVVAEHGRIAGLRADDGQGADLGGGIVAPGFVDLQVNGGGGSLLGQGDPDEALRRICAAHRGLGTLGLLPTLITAAPATTQAVIAAGIRAAKAGLPGFLGLHLEGPHLDPKRHGAHDPALIRRMDDGDLALLLDASRALPALMVTLAPEAATPGQIAALAESGIVVSLGHSDCCEDTARAAFAAGACCVTHLFNAMSPLTHRAPGLVGAALDSGVAMGIIPDGIHVARTPFRLAARQAGERVFAVTDAMAVAGTDLTAFDLGGRTIHRRAGRLTLEDGTLAGADVSMPQALRWMIAEAGLDAAEALAMMTRRPAELLGLSDRGVIAEGARAEMVHLSDGFALLDILSG
ncbi:N-acetylglucosamine-6-phosphate deacetylase [Rhodobacter sp. NTK016B]|uniref:N-acetylglucosamine-6-phosphate deacetylase n=1 Tax=Rhodobacter sp. NTK016B TaxID=2759676 RepID=UPI001A8F5EBE|nr:N-acetylglucosamine-6-phosphate deacetylase [Rhodobacter sp. NTK016B]MBN8290451.1 N-acetylglucosamine-6-phosphate deacetylase [Rhodobacter sp. NTK016B]